jgi:hypothetical protein
MGPDGLKSAGVKCLSLNNKRRYHYSSMGLRQELFNGWQNGFKKLR